MFWRWKLIAYLGASLRSLLPLPAVIHIVFRGRPLSIHLVDDNSFPFLFYEVFIQEDYRVALPHRPDYIVDAGANYGLASLYFACLYPDAVIHAFEPSSKNFRYLEINTRPFKNIHIHQMGLYSRSGTERLYLHPSSGGNSMINAAGGFEDIRTTTLDEFFVAQGIPYVDVLKIDVEGAEEEILTTARLLNLVYYIVGEIHFELSSWDKIEQILTRSFKVTCSKTSPGIGLFTAVNLSWDKKRLEEQAAGAAAH
jgi:FkbM family methyltransferase